MLTKVRRDCMSNAKEANHKYIKEALERLEQHDLDAAIVAAERALGAAPKSSLAIHVLGLVAARINENERAEQLFRHAYDLTPTCFEHCEALAIICAKLENVKEALFFGKLAATCEQTVGIVGLLPNWLGDFENTLKRVQVDSPYENARKLFEAGRLEASISAFQAAAEENPSDIRCWRGLRDALLLHRRSHDALVVSQAISSMQNGDNSDLIIAAGILTDLGRFEEARDCYHTALSGAYKNPNFYTAYAQDLVLMPEVEASELENIVSLCDTLLVGQINGWRSSNAEIANLENVVDQNSNENALPVIGVLSGRLFDPRIFPALRWLAKANVELVIYNNGLLSAFKVPDIISDKTIVDIRRFDDSVVVKMMERDELDILVDLDGFMQTGRASVVAARPAKKCVSWYGLPIQNSKIYDYYIGKNGLVNSFGEPIAPIPYCLLSAPEAFETLKGSDASLVLGIVGGTRKITNDLIANLANLLAKFRDKKIVLSPKLLGSVHALDEVEEIFSRFGLLDFVEYVAPESGPDPSCETEFAEDLSSVYAQLAAHCDILLDPGPDGDVAAFEAAIFEGSVYLGMSNSFAPNTQVAAIASSLGLDECVAPNATEFWRLVTKVLDGNIGIYADKINSAVTKHVEAGIDLDTINQIFTDIIDKPKIPDEA